MKNLTQKIIIVAGLFGLSIGIGAGVALNSRPTQIAKSPVNLPVNTPAVKTVSHATTKVVDIPKIKVVNPQATQIPKTQTIDIVAPAANDEPPEDECNAECQEIRQSVREAHVAKKRAENDYYKIYADALNMGCSDCYDMGKFNKDVLNAYDKIDLRYSRMYPSHKYYKADADYIARKWR
jgi:hypothetical protein